MSETILCWLHFGDLHITEAAAPNHADFLALIEAANRHLAGHVDFALLPGDNADDGTAAQFRLVRAAIDRLAIPVHILPGDHDFQSRRLDAFHAVLGAERLPKSVGVAGHRCLFLDIVSGGAGGADFRLAAAQLDWLGSELTAAERAGERPVLFMHAYPADLRDGGAALAALLARFRVPCVDMGHTHYNELANDGATIFAATRSTGQIEEGPAGFAVAAIDGGVVSWRFHELGAGWPLVLVTSPADHRLIIDPASPDQVLSDSARVRAKIWSGAGVRRATCRIDHGRPVALAPDAEEPSYWTARLGLRDLADGLHRLCVAAEDGAESQGSETITVLIRRDGSYAGPARHRDGSDRDAIGAWPEKGIPGGQLGPNRNGRRW